MAQINTEKYPQILREISTKYRGIKAFHLRFLRDVSRLHAKEHLPSLVSVSSDPFITLLWRGYEPNSTSVTTTATSHWDLLNNWEEYYGSPFWNCFIGRRKWMTMLLTGFGTQGCQGQSSLWNEQAFGQKGPSMIRCRSHCSPWSSTKNSNILLPLKTRGQYSWPSFGSLGTEQILHNTCQWVKVGVSITMATPPISGFPGRNHDLSHFS